MKIKFFCLTCEKISEKEHVVSKNDYACDHCGGMNLEMIPPHKTRTAQHTLENHPSYFKSGLEKGMVATIEEVWTIKP
ncbi:MAG: hypothetical protein NT058_01155 [Candidatus Portnoybacteria bacterium]|nr:hypothetical protein [Candidatus Portnoybacteria bacterium]